MRLNQDINLLHGTLRPHTSQSQTENKVREVIAVAKLKKNE